MSDINLDYLLDEVSPEYPCGKNLEEDSVFLQLEDAMRFVEERQMGDSILPAEEPDWKLVHKLAMQLLEQTRDIQVAMYLTCSLLRSNGLDGFNQGLSLLNGWLDKYWDLVYPQQDAEDDYPILRINTLSSLNDYTLIRKAINYTPLIQSALGAISWHDIEVSQGKALPIKDEEVYKDSVIDAIFQNLEADTLQHLSLNINQSLEQVQRIASTVTDKAGAVNTPVLSALIELLQSITKFVAGKLQDQSADEGESDGAEMNNEGHLSNQTDGISIKKAGIHNRNDVIKTIDEICQYFERCEPSSPVPFLLVRAKKLLAMNFMEILQDMTPDAINQAENICGKQKDKED